MKKTKIANYLKTGILFFGMIFVFNSCQKEEVSLVDTTVNNLEKVKKVFATQFNKSAFPIIKNEPLWEKANVYFSEDGQYIEIPFREVKQEDLEKSTSMSLDHLIATVNSSGEVELNIVHYFAQDIKKTMPNFEQLNYYDTDTFHGFITKYDLNKNVIAVDRYINGLKSQEQYTVKNKTKKEMDLLSRADESCTTETETIVTETCAFWYNTETLDVTIIYCDYKYDYMTYTVCGGSSGDTGGGGTTTISIEDRYQINDSNLKPCMSKVMDSIKTLTNDIQGIITKFNGNVSGYNWELKDGTTTGVSTAQTSTVYDTATGTVSTTFDTTKYSKASDLSWARTIFHESIHAYIVAIHHNTSTSSEKEELLGPNWRNRFINKGHDFIANNYIDPITNALVEFGAKQGYTHDRTFYEDLAWGGLSDTPAFNNYEHKDRANNVILIELTKKGLDGKEKPQKGQNAGC